MPAPMYVEMLNVVCPIARTMYKEIGQDNDAMMAVCARFHQPLPPLPDLLQRDPPKKKNAKYEAAESAFYETFKKYFEADEKEYTAYVAEAYKVRTCVFSNFSMLIHS